jgi:hypothetical protein
VNLCLGGDCRHPLGHVIPSVSIAVALLAVLVSSSVAASAAPTQDPIIGDWNWTYPAPPAPETVTMTLASGAYTETAKTPVRVIGSSCDLPTATVIATFRQTGPGTYAGQSGLWTTNNCSFLKWTDTTFNLSSDGNTLTENVHGYPTNLTYTKI